MNEICNNTECTGCGACASICPVKCIDLRKDPEGFKYPYIDESRCIKCNLCRNTCPNNSMLNTYNNSIYYMAQNIDNNILANSSSGGVFAALAYYVLNNDGVVIGAYQDSEKIVVKHIIISNIDELYKLQSSKYYQSDISEIYPKIKNLIANKKVLFVGTACQIAGILSYLKDTGTTNLITCDVLCHGVTNDNIIKSYIKSKEKKFKKKIVNFKFRTKQKWSSGGGTRVKLIFEDNTSHLDKHWKFDTFYLGFNDNLFLRKSCYKCRYSGVKRISDFTIGDFWGVDSKYADPETIAKGISVLLVNSEKGKEILPNLKTYIKYTQIDPNDAINNNPPLRKRNYELDKRTKFFKKWCSNHNYDKAVLSMEWKIMVKAKIKIVINKLFNKNLEI